MKRNTDGHPKTLDLKVRLGKPLYQVVGVLESLWLFSARYAKRGDVGKFTNEAIAKGIDWERDPDQLVEHLVGAGYLDRCDCHRVRIHDWPDHADQTVSRSYEIAGQPARGGRPAVPGLGFLECYSGRKLATETRVTLASNPSATLAAEASQPLPLPSSTPGPTPWPSNDPPIPPDGGSDGDPDAVVSGTVLTQVELLAVELIGAGGKADRTWRRQARWELRARGLEAGTAVLRAQITAQRESTAASRESGLRASLVRRLVDQARAGGRDGVREWRLVLDQLEGRVNAHSFGTWFRAPYPLGVITDEEGDRLLVAVPNDSFVTWLSQNYQQLVNEAVDAAALAPMSVLFVVEPPAEKAG